MSIVTQLSHPGVIAEGNLKERSNGGSCQYWDLSSHTCGEVREADAVRSPKPEMDANQSVKCKIVVVGDSQCGKTALLHGSGTDHVVKVTLLPILSVVVEPSSSPYYDNVRPLSYPDSDAVLICFDISRPETLDSVLKKWRGEIQEFCPNTKILLVGCKSDLRTDLTTLVELSNHRQTPSENSVRDIFHVATLACVSKNSKNVKRSKSSRATKRISHMPSRPELAAVATDLRKDKAKSCTVM
ncbi:hypothetical protein CRUP_037749 [Coryphaenoides rupestris]|nr:hypothetical protein CRUP_037749 [Coryphaenoides rupestris]